MRLRVIAVLLGATLAFGNLSLAGEATQAATTALSAAQHQRLNESCEGCHDDVAREWRQSNHRNAYNDPTFQRALSLEPLPFCRGCHAPAAPSQRAAEGWAADNGVTCVACHVRDGKVLGTREVKGAPHAMAVDADFGTNACASCHEFKFPRSPERMQKTMTEHRASPSADRACSSCHMPVGAAGAPAAGRRGRSHEFAFGTRPEDLRGALKVTARRVAVDVVELTLKASGVGHSFPTGDLFRRIEVVAHAKGAPAESAARASVGRRFALDRIPEVELEDTRIPAGGERVVRLTVPRAMGREIGYRVLYQRVELPEGHGAGSRQEAPRRAPPKIAFELVLHEGAL